MALIRTTLFEARATLADEHFSHFVVVDRIHKDLMKDHRTVFSEVRELFHWCQDLLGKQAFGPILNPEEARRPDGRLRSLDPNIATLDFDTEAAWCKIYSSIWCFKDKTVAAAFKIRAL